MKDVEQVNVWLLPWVLVILKSDTENKLITWALILVSGEKWACLKGKPSHLSFLTGYKSSLNGTANFKRELKFCEINSTLNMQFP